MHPLKTIFLLTALPELALNTFDVHHFSLMDEQTNTLTDTLENLLNSSLTNSEYLYGRMRSTFGLSPWLQKELTYNNLTLDRNGRTLGSSKGARVWPNARVPYEFSDSIDYMEWNIMQSVFSNISSVTNIKFVPRTAQDSDYLLITEDIETYGCGCCSIGLGYLAGSGAHVLVLAPVSKGGCGVNHIGGTHEMLHVLGLAHTQNRPDRCNYIDVRTDLLTGWGEWRVAQISGPTDWFSLRIPYDCSSYIHYYQLQGAFWKKEVEEQVDQFMGKQGCENSQRGQFINKCLVDGGHTEGSRVVKEGYDLCLDKWGAKHKKCVDKVIKRFPTFKPVDPNGRCKANGINRSKRKSHEISQWDIWALNVAYGGQLPPCQNRDKVGNGVCDVGNNNVGCDYDGGDCCLPQANDRDCIDPCGVRLKFFGGRNRPCRKAPVTQSFCSDHYWYGDNKCSQEYCRQTDEKYLQWQCKQTCGLCNTDPSQKEMDQICNSYISQNLRNKYKKKTKFNKKEHIITKGEKSIKQTKPKQKRPAKIQGNSKKTTFEKNKHTTLSKDKFLGKSKPSKQNSIFTSNNSKPSKRKSTGKTKQVNEILRSSGKSKPLKPNVIFSLIKPKSSTRKLTGKTKQPKLKQERSNKNTIAQKKTQTSKLKPSKLNSIFVSNKPKPSRKKSTGKTKQVKEAPRTSGGFEVVKSAERRKQLRSFWSRRG